MFADVGRQAASRDGNRHACSRSAPRCVKAVERDKVELAVAPLQQRACWPTSGWSAPAIAVRVAERLAPGRRRRTAVAAGHSKDKR